MKKYVYWILLLLWLLLAMSLSRQTGSETVQTSLALTHRLAEILGRIGIAVAPVALHGAVRKAAHVVIYLILGFLACRAGSLTFSRRWIILPVLLVCFSIGVADEFQKAFIPGRHCQWDEAALNCASALAGILAARYLRDPDREGAR